MDLQPAIGISARAIAACGDPCNIGTPFMMGNVLQIIIIMGAITFVIWSMRQFPELA